jgi:hypothetical protein
MTNVKTLVGRVAWQAWATAQLAISTPVAVYRYRREFKSVLPPVTTSTWITDAFRGKEE